MKSRIIFVFMLFMVLWVVMLLRGAYLQIIPNEKLAGLQKRQFEMTIDATGRRGLIVDRNGRELAATLASQSLFADPYILERPRAVSRRLAGLLKVSYGEIYGKLKSRKRRFVWLKRHLSDSQVATIKKWDIRGLGLMEEPKRVYPNNSLAAQLLGFVGSDGSGLEGLELRYNQQLSGESKRVILPRDARGRPLLPDGAVLTNAADGAKIELTIDSELQFIVEKELAQAISRHGADGAVGVVVDPHTGEILAMASQPSFNLGDSHAAPLSLKRNRPITDVFEPGSTMKAFVVASALRDGQVKPSTKFDCEGGRMKIGDRWIKEADRDHDYKMLTVAEILAYSSNIGTAKIALQMGADKLRKSLLDFGFGQKLEVDLPGESRGILQPLPWRPHLVANTSFGHGVAVTPLQLAVAYASIANGGMLKRPYIVRRIVHSQDGEVEEFQPKDLRQVLTPEQAATMRIMLRAATMEHATGVNARIAGFPVAGKTGTAQKVDPEKGGYIPGAYISSFAGFVPAHDPKFVIYVAIDNPRKEYYASQVAAPVFSRIAQFAVRKAGLAPILLSEQNLIGNDRGGAAKTKSERANEPPVVARARQELQDTSGKAKQVPNLVGLTLREVYQQLHGLGLKAEIRGQGVVSSISPAAGEELPSDGKVRIQLEPIPIAPLKNQ